LSVAKTVGSDPPAVHVPAESPDLPLDLVDSALHRQQQLRLPLQCQLTVRERLAGLDSDLLELRPQRNLHCRRSGRGAELQHEVQIGKGIGLGQFLVDLRPVDLRGCRWYALFHELRERLAAITSL